MFRHLTFDFWYNAGQCRNVEIGLYRFRWKISYRRCARMRASVSWKINAFKNKLHRMIHIIVLISFFSVLFFFFFLSIEELTKAAFILIIVAFVSSYNITEPSMQHNNNNSWLGENFTQLVWVGNGIEIIAILWSLSCCDTSYVRHSIVTSPYIVISKYYFIFLTI